MVQISLSTELDKLMMTAPAGIRDQVEQNMDGFKRLFAKFITSKGPSVQWERIEKLSQDAVSSYISSGDLIVEILVSLNTLDSPLL